MAREVEEKKAPGVSMLIARHGKIAYRQSVGALAPGRAGDDARRDLPHLFDDQADRLGRGDDAGRGGAAVSSPIPSSKYIPAFADTKVGVDNGDKLDLAPLKRPITVQDLMRHTSGLTYGFTGASQVQKLVAAATDVGDARTDRWPRMSRRWLPCRSCISPERSGNIASRPTCSAA